MGLFAHLVDERPRRDGRRPAILSLELLGALGLLTLLGVGGALLWGVLRTAPLPDLAARLRIPIPDPRADISGDAGAAPGSTSA